MNMPDKTKHLHEKAVQLKDAFLDLLYPPKCAFCHGLLAEKGVLVCPACLENLPYTVSGEAVQHFGNVSACVSPLYYDGHVRDSLLRYKFHGVTSYAPVYAEMIAAALEREGFEFDVITWVPVSRKRLRTRGYDQARLIAEELAAITGVPCAQMLVKIKNNAVQSKTGGYEKRKKNVAGVYAFKGGDIAGKTVLLADDIVTTGSTMSEAAGVLLSAGAAGVYGAAAARKRN